MDCNNKQRASEKQRTRHIEGEGVKKSRKGQVGSPKTRGGGVCGQKDEQSGKLTMA